MRLPFLVISLCILVACHERQEAVVPEESLPVWENTNIRFDGDFVVKSFESDDQLYLLLSKSFVVVDGDLGVRTLMTFDKQVWDNPYPTMANGIFNVADHTVYDVNGTYSDSVTVHFLDTRNNASGRLNLTAVRKEIAESTNSGFNAEISAINSDNRIFFTVVDYTNNKLMGIIYDMHSADGKVALENRRIFTIGDHDTELIRVSAVGRYFVVSDYERTYKIDGEGNVIVFDEERLYGSPFFFAGKWNVHTGSGYFESADGESWIKNGLAYGEVYCLGTFDDQLYYVDHEEFYCRASIQTTRDMNVIDKLVIENDNSACFQRLNISAGYLYSIDNDRQLWRVKLSTADEGAL